MILLTVSVAINYLDRGSALRCRPFNYQRLTSFSGSNGTAVFCVFLELFLFQLLAGWLVDRFSIKWIYAAGYLIWSLATAAVGLVNGLSALLAARLLLGIGESVAYPASSKIIVRYFPEERRGLANALVDAGAKVGSRNEYAARRFYGRHLWLASDVSVRWLGQFVMARPMAPCSALRLAGEKRLRREGPRLA